MREDVLKLKEFLDGYVVLMNLVGHDYSYKISSSIKTDLYIVQNGKKEVMEFFYHKTESGREGFIFIYEYNVDISDFDVAARIKQWMKLYSTGEGKFKEIGFKYEVNVGMQGVDKFIDFFTRCILKQELVV
jgi:hypothetical protein